VSKKTFLSIAPALSLEGIFTYSVPEHLINDASIGKRTLIPFGRRTITGYIVDKKTELNAEELTYKDKIKDILDVLDLEPLFDDKKLKFFKWMADYYFSPLGEVMQLAHPPELNVKSVRKFRQTDATPQGKLTQLQAEVLSLSGKTISLKTLQTKLKGKPVLSAINSLIKKNLIEEVTTLTSDKGTRQDTLVTIAEGINSDEVLVAIKKKSLQLRIFNHLLENGDSLLKDLRKTITSPDSALKSLEENGFIKTSKLDIEYNPMEDVRTKDNDHRPNEEQNTAIKEISNALNKNTFSPFLLHGVTGSGKTLVYIEAIKKAISLKKTTIMLVPEIALTTGAVSNLAHIFPGRVALVHSGLSPMERLTQWHKINNGEVDIVIGARSALFSPLNSLGLIIVDEEHDPSYKQEEGVRYNAKDAAMVLASYIGATVVLGSATPSIETFFNTTNDKLKLITMKERINTRPLPPVDLLDVKKNKDRLICAKLHEEIDNTLSNGHQVMLLLNRRGFSNFIACGDCGHFFKCLNCSVTLTMHKGKKELRCHYCDVTIPMPKKCPECESIHLTDPGIGTEKLEEEIRFLFPDAVVGRMDSDTTRKKGTAKKIIESVEDHQIDILIGTQMVSKGHNFPNMALVGVIDADTSLNIPDFRSDERTFHLITQSAGRGGRFEIDSHVYVQTVSPDNFALKTSAEHDYNTFYKEEIKIREDALYPPFSKLCIIRLSGIKENSVLTEARKLKDFTTNLDLTDVFVLGPAPAPLAKLRGKYRYQFLLKSPDVKKLHKTVWQMKKSFEKNSPRAVAITIDMDPLNTL